jgi:hypothetical protein
VGDYSGQVSVERSLATLATRTAQEGNGQMAAGSLGLRQPIQAVATMQDIMDGHFDFAAV